MKVDSAYALFTALCILLTTMICICDGLTVPKQSKAAEDIETVTTNGLDEKLKEMNTKLTKDNTVTAKEEKKKNDDMKRLETEVTSFTKKAELAKEGFGQHSEERAKMLHSLGRSLYKLNRFSEALIHSQGKPRKM